MVGVCMCVYVWTKQREKAQLEFVKNLFNEKYSAEKGRRQNIKIVNM